MNIQFIDLAAQRRRIGDRLNAAIGRVLDEGRYIGGPDVPAFEAELAAFAGVDHVIGCGNGTDALQLVLMAWGVGDGDAVFVPSFTFAATAEVVALVGATPVMVDIDEVTYNIDCDHLAASIDFVREHTDYIPRAIIPVDLFGQCADYGRLATLARDNGLKILEDGAQGLGGTLDGRQAGSFGDGATTSFFPAKPLGCYGDGGAVLTNDAGLAETVRSLTVHGKGLDKYDNVRVGMNSRLDTLQAAILREKLAIFPDEIDRRQTVAARYASALGDAVRVPHVIDGATSSWALYTIASPHRDAIAAALAEAGIPSAVYYRKPLHLQPAYAHCPRLSDRLDVAERASREVLSLPMHPYLDERVQDRIVDVVRRAAKASGA